jgi:glycosyltransferase involved in cell wall biosynthesis
MINFNGLPWLEPAARSVLASTGVDLELVIVDDCSSDASRDCIARMAAEDPRVVPVLSENNRGISGARNLGISKSRGTYIALIDSDDLFLPDTISRQIACFERLEKKASNLSLLAADAWLINEIGERKGRYISPEWWGTETIEKPPLWTLPSTFFFRRDRAATFFEGYRSADAPIFVRRMEQIGPIGFLGEPIIEYRMRLSSVTNHRGADMVKEMKAAEQSRLDGRLGKPYLPDEIATPDWNEVAAWVHGRNAKNAMINGQWLSAAFSTAKAALADPKLTIDKIRRSIRSR